MSSSATKTPDRFKVIAFVMVLLVLIAIWWIAPKLNQKSRSVRTPSGTVIKLEGCKFQSGTVRYDLPNRPLARMLSKVLPKPAKERFSWLRPESTVVVRPSFPNEPLFSVAFSSWDASGNWRQTGTKLVVLDDRGNVFDPGIYDGNGTVFEALAFPHRGRELRLRLMDGDNPIAEFRIPNPCPGPHPVWKAQNMPVVATNAGLEISLESFVSETTRHRTRCVFRVWENGKESTAWLPAVFEISDATGNHWRPISHPLPSVNGRVAAYCLGALWPEEEAWKLRVEFKPVENEPHNQTACAVEFLAKPEQARDDLVSPEPN